MAVVEIARIQVRRGQENQTGVPLLAGGEFAWAADTEKLYIGLKIEDGGSRDANVEILTENHLRNFFSSLSPLSTTASYVYRVGENLTLNPSYTANPFQIEFERTVQNRLDDNEVSILNFGNVGSGPAGDDTQIIQYAHDHLFLNKLGKLYNRNSSLDNPIVITARTLKLPTGIYNLQETVFITKGTHIKGEGPDKTIIRITSGGHSAFQTCSFQSNKGIYAVQSGILAYVRFGDPEFGSGDNDPDDIIIENLTIEYAAGLSIQDVFPMIGLHGSDNSIIRNVVFRGSFQLTDNPSANLSCGIELKGTEMISCENITIDNCKFENMFYGILSNHDIRNTYITNCKFNTCNRGIAFNENIDPLAQFGPRFARILNNRFERIKEEAIYAGPNSSNWSTNHISENNQFIDVGNLLSSEGEGAGTPVITFDTPENRSVDDYFNRFEFHLNATQAYIFNTLVNGASTLELIKGRFRNLIIGQTISLGRFPISDKTYQINLNYNISHNRVGNIFINVNFDGTTTITEYFNQTNEDGDFNISWTSQPDVVKNFVELRIANNGDANYLLHYSVTLLT